MKGQKIVYVNSSDYSEKPLSDKYLADGLVSGVKVYAEDEKKAVKIAENFLSFVEYVSVIDEAKEFIKQKDWHVNQSDFSSVLRYVGRYSFSTSLETDGFASGNSGTASRTEIKDLFNLMFASRTVEIEKLFVSLGANAKEYMFAHEVLKNMSEEYFSEFKSNLFKQNVAKLGINIAINIENIDTSENFAIKWSVLNDPSFYEEWSTPMLNQFQALKAKPNDSLKEDSENLDFPLCIRFYKHLIDCYNILKSNPDSLNLPIREDLEALQTKFASFISENKPGHIEFNSACLDGLKMKADDFGCSFYEGRGVKHDAVKSVKIYTSTEKKAQQMDDIFANHFSYVLKSGTLQELLQSETVNFSLMHKLENDASHERTGYGEHSEIIIEGTFSDSGNINIFDGIASPSRTLSSLIFELSNKLNSNLIISSNLFKHFADDADIYGFLIEHAEHHSQITCNNIFAEIVKAQFGNAIKADVMYTSDYTSSWLIQNKKQNIDGSTHTGYYRKQYEDHKNKYSIDDAIKNVEQFKSMDIYKFYLSLKSTGDLLIANGVKYMPSKEKFDEFTGKLKSFIDEHVELTAAEKLECEMSDSVVTDFAQLSSENTVDEEVPENDIATLLSSEAEELVEGGDIVPVGVDADSSEI